MALLTYLTVREADGRILAAQQANVAAPPTPPQGLGYEVVANDSFARAFAHEIDPDDGREKPAVREWRKVRGKFEAVVAAYVEDDGTLKTVS